MSTPSQPVRPSLRWYGGGVVKYGEGAERKELIVKTGERHTVTMSDGTKHDLLVRVANDGSTRQQRRAAARGKT